MMREALILLALLGASAAFTKANTGCGFQCKDGDCVDLNKRCNGRADCSNGRDEDASLCDALPTLSMPVNTTVTARVEHGDHSGILLLLCGKRCTKVWLMGTSEDGKLCHWTWTCELRGGKCIKVQADSLTNGLPRGEVVLEVQHRPQELRVWRKDHPDDVVKAAVDPADDATLRVRPHNWEADMPVHFSSPVAVTA